MRLKKTLAFALAIAMVFGLVSIAAAAPAAHGTAFADVPADHDKASQIAALGALGLALGESGLGGNFNPNGTLNRAEFATFAVRLAGLESSAKALSAYPPSFNDAAEIPEWAYGYVNVAQSEGIVIGDDQGNFNAAQEVTYAEALTMLVRVTGWKDTVTGTVWPMNYLTRAISTGISEGVSLQANAPISRADMAALLYNAGGTDKPEYVDGKWTGDSDDDTAIFFSKSVTFTPAGYNPANGKLGDETLADDVYLGGGLTSIEAAVGRSVVGFKVGGKIVYLEPATAGKRQTGVYVGVATETDADGDDHDFIELKDGTLVEYDKVTTKFSINGGTAAVLADPTTEDADDVLDANDELSITLSKDNVATVVHATRYKAGDFVTAKPHTKKASDITDYDYVEIGGDKIRPDRAVITLNGEPVTFDKLAVDDHVLFATVNDVAAADKVYAYRIDATRQTIEGKVTRFSEFGTTRKATLQLADNSSKEVTLAAGVATPSIGSTVKYALSAKGAAVKELSVSGAVQYVRIAGVGKVSEGISTVWVMNVDRAGTTVSYSLGADDERLVKVDGVDTKVEDLDLDDEVAVITVGGGLVTEVATIAATVDATIYSVNADDNVVTVQNDTTKVIYVSAAGFVSYDDDGDYVKTADLSKGQKVSVYVDGSNQVHLIVLKP